MATAEKPWLEGPCRNCHAPVGSMHRIGCVVSIAGADLVAAGKQWHRVAHTGPFDSCSSATCYNTHPAVIR